MKTRRIHPNIVKPITVEEIRAKAEQTMKYNRELAYKNKISNSLDEIAAYNSELVSLNNKILNKINSLDDTILFFYKAFNINSEKTEEELKTNNALLLELITVIESKDEKKLSSFMGKLTGTVGIELLVSYLKMKIGLTI